MRLNITSEKPYMMDFILDFFNKNLVGKKVDAFINGVTYKGTITKKFKYETQKPYQVLFLHIDDKVEKIPILLDKTKMRIIKGNMYFFETEKHATRIEVIE